VQRVTAKGSHVLPFAVWTLLAVTAAALAGCADVSGQALQQDVAQLRQDLNALTLSVHRGRGDTETVVGQIDRRTKEQATESAKQSAALNSRLEALSAEVARLTARMDELSQRVDSLGRSAPSSGGTSGGTSGGGSGAIPPPARTGPPSAQPGPAAAAPRQIGRASCRERV